MSRGGTAGDRRGEPAGPDDLHESRGPGLESAEVLVRDPEQRTHDDGEERVCQLRVQVHHRAAGQLREEPVRDPLDKRATPLHHGG